MSASDPTAIGKRCVTASMLHLSFGHDACPSGTPCGGARSRRYCVLTVKPSSPYSRQLCFALTSKPSRCKTRSDDGTLGAGLLASLAELSMAPPAGRDGACNATSSAQSEKDPATCLTHRRDLLYPLRPLTSQALSANPETIVRMYRTADARPGLRTPGGRASYQQMSCPYTHASTN